MNKKEFKIREKELMQEMEDAQYGMKVNCGTDYYEEFWDDFLEAEEELFKLRTEQSKKKDK